MDDTVAPVRDAAAEALGTLLKLLGERAMAPFVDQLDKIKLDKVILKMLWLEQKKTYSCFIFVLDKSLSTNMTTTYENVLHKFCTSAHAEFGYQKFLGTRFVEYETFHHITTCLCSKH